MARMTPSSARALHKGGARPSEVLNYNPVEHEEEMQDMMTGLAGLVYSTDLKSAHSFEIGHRLPAMVIDTDVMRLFIDPVFKKVTPRRVIFEAFTYQGEWNVYDTDKMFLIRPEEFISELNRIHELVSGVTHSCGAG